MISKTLRISVVLLSLNAFAQDSGTPEIKGLRINGQIGSNFPAANMGGAPITVEFDLDRSQPLDFRVKFYQCDKDWNRTENQFINDAMRNSTKFPIPYERAPIGVEHYVYHYTLQVPGFPGIEQFAYSGNYVFEIWDKEQTMMLASGRFFVVEHTVPVSMVVRNRLLPSQSAPLNQVDKIQVGVTIPAEDVAVSDRLIANEARTVDIYRNRELGTLYRIDVDDNNPNTFVDGFGTNSLTFMVDNVQPGNEYRSLDLTDVDYYPPNQLSRNRDGADLGRMFHQGNPDHDGVSIVLTNSRYSDYLRFQFELDRESDDLSPLYVVGDFNNWTPQDSWKMNYDPSTQRYILQAIIRRGIYDYQYVSNGNDWRRVEGNDWRTVNEYTALVYYHDIRFGGFDRIIGISQQMGPGGTEPSTK
jgi:hypothetical protein